MISSILMQPSAWFCHGLSHELCADPLILTHSCSGLLAAYERLLSTKQSLAESLSVQLSEVLIQNSHVQQCLHVPQCGTVGQILDHLSLVRSLRCLAESVGVPSCSSSLNLPMNCYSSSSLLYLTQMADSRQQLSG